jgi:hypothetical protein
MGRNGGGDAFNLSAVDLLFRDHVAAVRQVAGPQVIQDGHGMSPEHARIAAAVLVALTALLVGFHGASTLMTLTQLGAGPPKASQPPRSHASLVPQPPVPVIKPAEQRAPTISAGEEIPTPAEQPRQSTAQQPVEVVVDDQSGIAAAAKAKAQAEMDAMEDRPDRPPPERRRRYRAPRPELHKVY